MFTINNIIITFFATGLVGIGIITYILSRQHNKVNDVMKLNKDVTPLFLHRATQHKFNTIRSKMPHADNIHHEKIRLNLDELSAKFRNKTICIRTYNKGLDHLMKQLNKKA